MCQNPSRSGACIPFKPVYVQQTRLAWPTCRKGSVRHHTQQLWSRKAERLFRLQLPDEEHAADRQSKWRIYVKNREKAEAHQTSIAELQAAIKRGECYSDVHGTTDSGKAITDVVPQAVSVVLAAAPNLTDEDRAALQSSVVVRHADCFDEDEQMRSTSFTVRLYSPASTAAVDVHLSNFFRLRYSSPSGCEFAMSITCALVDIAMDPVTKAYNYKRGDWMDLYRVLDSTYDAKDDPRLSGPKDMEEMDLAKKQLLTLQQLQQLRRHLFGDAAAGLSDRLSDCELVQLLVVSSGAQWNDFVPYDAEAAKKSGGQPRSQLSPYGMDLSRDGWLEHHAREMCGALRPEVRDIRGQQEDAEWQPEDVEAKILWHITDWAAKNRSKDVRDRIKQRIREGSFTKEAFIRDGAPEGYNSGHDSDNDDNW